MRIHQAIQRPLDMQDRHNILPPFLLQRLRSYSLLLRWTFPLISIWKVLSAPCRGFFLIVFLLFYFIHFPVHLHLFFPPSLCYPLRCSGLSWQVEAKRRAALWCFPFAFFSHSEQSSCECNAKPNKQRHVRVFQTMPRLFISQSLAPLRLHVAMPDNDQREWRIRYSDR